MRALPSLLLSLMMASSVLAAASSCTDCNHQFQQPMNFCGACGSRLHGEADRPRSLGTEIGPEDSLLREFLIALHKERRIMVPTSGKIGPRGQPYVTFPNSVTAYQVTRKWKERTRPRNPKYSYDVRIQTQYGPRDFLWYTVRARIQVSPQPLLLKFTAVAEGDRGHLHGAREMPVHEDWFLDETEVTVREFPTLPTTTEVVYEIPEVKPRNPPEYKFWPIDKRRIWDRGDHSRR